MAILTFEDNRSTIDLWRDEGTLESRVDSLTARAIAEFPYLWEVWRRRNQEIPEGMGGQYRIWMFRAGRGSGKTRSGAETVRMMVERGCRRIALIAPTAADVRDVMVEGESGLLSVFPDRERPVYQPSLRRITFANGAIATSYSADEPERLRGPQHDFAWMDEPASMPRGAETFSNLMFGLRLGEQPWLMITGTPKPVRWLRELSEREDTVTTIGSTFDNERYLAKTFITDVIGRYEGTRLGRQELYAEWLDDVEGALWTERVIDNNRIASFDRTSPWQSLNVWLESGGQSKLSDRRAWRTIIAVDPPGETAECGIIAASAPTQGVSGVDHCVILEDASIAGRPEEWGRQVVATAKKWNAEKIVVESNQGGDMVRATIHAVDPSVKVEKITARVSKAARAEPVSALYERGFVHHVGFFPTLESQMVTWTKEDSKSPDRMDALVHAVSTLLTEQAQVRASVLSPTSRRIG